VFPICSQFGDEVAYSFGAARDAWSGSARRFEYLLANILRH